MPAIPPLTTNQNYNKNQQEKESTKLVRPRLILEHCENEIIFDPSAKKSKW